MNNPTDNDTSGKPDPDNRSEISAVAEVEMQRRFNELRQGLLDKRAKTIDWWLAVVAGVLTFFGVVVAIGGYIGFERFQEIESEAKKSAEQAQRYAEQAKSHRDRAEHNADISAKIVDDDPKKAKQIIAKVRENPEASPIDKAIARAVSLQQQGKKDEAVEKWRAVANIAEESDNNLAAIAWFSVGYLLQDPKDRISAYDEAIRLKPGLAEAYTNRGNARLALEQHEAAIVDHDMAIRLNPDYASAYSNRGLAKHKLGQYKAAIADFDQAIRLKSDLVQAYTNRGNARRALGQHEAAIADHDMAIRLNPDFAKAYTNRGLVKHKLGQYKAAIADFDQAIRLKPDFAVAYYNRGNAKAVLERYKAAIADYDEAIHLKPDFVEAYYNRGVDKKTLGLKDEARKDFKTALELARNANNAKIVGQAEEMLRSLATDGSS